MAMCLTSLANFRQFNHNMVMNVGVPVKLNSGDSLEILDVMKTLNLASNFTKQTSSWNNQDFNFGPALSTIEGNEKVRYFEYPFDKLLPIELRNGTMVHYLRKNNNLEPFSLWINISSLSCLTIWSPCSKTFFQEENVM